MVESDSCIAAKAQARECHEVVSMCKDSYFEAEDDLKKCGDLASKTNEKLLQSVAREEMLHGELDKFYRDPFKVGTLAIIVGLLTGFLAAK